MQWMVPAARLLGIGWYFALCVVAGALGGIWLDGQLGTSKVFAVIGIFLGLAAALYGGYRMLTEWLRGTRSAPRRPGGNP